MLDDNVINLMKHDDLREKVESMAPALGLYPVGRLRTELGSDPSFTDLRRARRPGGRMNLITLSLVERDGIVYWETGSPVRPELRRSRRARTISGTLITRKEVLALEPNQIVGYLEKLDSELTPISGIRQWTETGFVPRQKVADSGKVLLIIHGTFSNSDHLLKEIQEAPEGKGREFLGRALKEYTQVLTFDHPTLSVSPMINAIDLRNAIGASRADIDILCHSRGGLVSRWWMEVFDSLRGRRKRAVFVGSPLTGTSLASPPRLRAGLKLLSTYAALLGNTSMALPLLSAPAALLRIFASVTRIGASLPIVDASVAMVPGLNGQSRVSNAQELQRLNLSCTNYPPRYFFVSSNFEPERLGWNVLRYVRDIGLRTSNVLADVLVFPGDNDLVVDTDAMTEPWTVGWNQENGHKFADSSAVHHTNYFRQLKTLELIISWFEIP